MSKATTKKAKPAAKKVGKAAPAKKSQSTAKKVVAKSPPKKVSPKVSAAKKVKSAKTTPKKKIIAKKVPSKKVSPKKQIVRRSPTNKSPPKVAMKKAPVKKTAVHATGQKISSLKPVAKSVTKELITTKVSANVVPSQSPSRDHIQRSQRPAIPKGKIARAIFPSTTTIKKEDRKTVSDRALISQVSTQAPNILETDDGANPGFMQNDEVFDETDYAQHLQLMEQADISRRARELNRPQTHPDFDGAHCVECEILIPKIRLDAGRVRCVVCQDEIENESKRLKNLERGRS